MQERPSRHPFPTGQALLLLGGDDLALVHADGEALRLLGTSLESIIGKRLADILPDSCGVELGARLEADSGADIQDCLETECILGDESTVRVRIHLHRLPTPAGLFHAAVLQAHPSGHVDASRLHPDDSSFVDFVGRLGHDVNNLLSTIIGSVGLLREETASQPDQGQAQLLEDAFSAARECADLIEDLMAAIGKQVLEPKLVDVNLAVTKVSELLARTVPENIAVHLLLADDLPDARVDPGRLDAVLLQIALNAREAIPGGGNIHLATARLGDGSAPRIAVSIRDDGHGIPGELRGRVLEPLFSTKSSRSGRGMGLSIANGFARQSGGSLHIDNASDGGTTVTLELPAVS